MAQSAQKTRLTLLDELRGFLVLCMIVYHTLLLMERPFGYEWAGTLFNLLEPLQPPFAAGFIFICGISSRFSRSNLKRGLKLALVAAAISLVTVYVLPLIGLHGFSVLFGILHCLAACILLYVPLRALLERIPVPVGITVCLLLYLCFYQFPYGSFGVTETLSVPYPESWTSTNLLCWLGLRNDQFFSSDYFPLLPNFFMFLAGTFAGISVQQKQTDHTLPEWVYPKRCAPLRWLGTHALLVYVLHTPAAYLILILIEKGKEALS